MFRARRYRVLVVFAAAVVFTFFHFARSRDWSYTVVEESIGVHPPDAHSNQPATPKPENPAAVAAIEESRNRVLPNPYRGTTSPPPEKIPSPVGPNSGSKDGTSRFKDASTDTPPVKLSTEDDPKDSAKEPVNKPTKVENAGSLSPPTTDNINSANEEEIDHGGTGRRAAERPEPGVPTAKWKKLPERFPVPAEEVIKLPKEQSKTIPKLQAKFKDESSSDKQERLQRLSAISAEFKHAWKGYKEIAMGHDEVKPLSKESEDPFNGWGATLVDSIDTLWIMQLKDEFSEALDVIKNIDFKTSLRADIPMFETTIRYLGGLLGAYDISDHRYPILLEKAEELAEVLIGAFDTPNRMPHLYYRWAPEYAAKPHRASSRAGLAEIGSLSLEFTRLAQLTKRDKYYDAIARITNELEKIQDSTSIPGLWPLRVNAQGCPKYSKNTSPRNSSPTREEHAASTTTSTTSMTHKTYAAPTDLESYLKLLPRDTNAGIEGHARPANVTTATGEPEIQAREQITLSAGQCNGGLGLPNSPRDNAYTMGGMADSTYEYLPKEYLLLGGLNEQYLNMYKKAATAARKSLLFQPMVKGGRDIRFMASTSSMTPGKTAELTPTDLEYEGTHLTCFVGGMFAIGAKAFGIDGDLELAAKLTDGCVWAYESTQTGVMPERFRLLPCEKGSACEWDPARFEAGVARYSRVDPEAGHSFRNGESSYEQRVNMISHDPPPGSASGSVPIPMPGSLNPHDSDVMAKRDGLGNHVEASSVASSPTSIPNGAELQNRDAPRSSLSPASPHIAEVGKDHLPAGMTRIPSPNYYLRPEAIESVFIMYRLTGDESWRRKGWQMFQAISKYTRTELANAAIHDVTAQKPIHKDTMESFWLAETLKYFYLLFSDPTVVDLDKYVLNTEAHPFLRPVA
ncbi:Glycoside hydrolase family 47 [Penicillium robsamsonii]|uniref:Glycoside hydrolase family 47 n=1 Tax=Penicillium robsamsonii TaxID=1792511 RepID=UPI0025499962|nr:Glycoside hydrolase family 47 [Penicillium robsamsonii]KAJ5823423.1 Glycoside hydrolase family 47 [Penicillium robsamsonii]